MILTVLYQKKRLFRPAVVIPSWRYYRTGELIEKNDSKLCDEMMKNKHLQNVTWQG